MPSLWASVTRRSAVFFSPKVLDFALPDIRTRVKSATSVHPTGWSS
jgi:hypothetical protein